MRPTLPTSAQGLSYPEVVIFIILTAIITLTLTSIYFVAMNIIIPNGSTEQVHHHEIAITRMEIILGQKQHVGYTQFYDICVSQPTLPACTVPNGYAVQSEIVEDTAINRKTITVNILKNGDTKFTLVSAVYE